MDAPSDKEQRRLEILAAAMELLSEKGYRGMSMLAVARRARASKETLYTWFGSKQGLIEALITWKAEGQERVLTRAVENAPADVEAVLREFGASMLTMFLSDPTLTMNRIAIGEATASPELSRIMIEKGRNRVRPAIVDYLARCRDKGLLTFDDPDEAADSYIGLLQGDLRVRGLMGVLPDMDSAQLAARASRTAGLFMRLYGVVPEKK